MENINPIIFRKVTYSIWYTEFLPFLTGTTEPSGTALILSGSFPPCLSNMYCQPLKKELRTLQPKHFFCSSNQHPYLSKGGECGYGNLPIRAIFFAQLHQSATSFFKSTSVLCKNLMCYKFTAIKCRMMVVFNTWFSWRKKHRWKSLSVV